MSVNYTADNDVVGGGLGGMGGTGMLPLWLLLFLGITGKGNGGLFGGNDHAGAGVLAGETQAKLDCLSQGQAALSTQLNEQTVGNRFTALTQQLNAMQAAAAECCCESRLGNQKLETAIAIQTSALLASGNNNTQRIIDQISANTLAACQLDAANLRSQLNEQRILTAIAESCGSKSKAA